MKQTSGGPASTSKRITESVSSIRDPDTMMLDSFP